MKGGGSGQGTAARRGTRPPRWYAAGDVNAFFGLAADNLTDLVVLAGLLVGAFGFPADLVLYRIVPGTALGVLVGDLWYTWLARRLARTTGRADVTAMPFGIDTPSLFGITFGVLGPVKLATDDPVLAWQVGMATTLLMGAAKLALAFVGEGLRQVVPRAALLGSIAGVSVLLIAFLPMMKVVADPLAGLVSLGLVLVTLVGGIRLPGGLPGALAAVAAGTAVHALQEWAGAGPAGPGLMGGEPWRLAIPWPTLAWVDALDRSWGTLSIALPFALATVIGGIDNTESALAAGDRYRTRDVLLAEAVATMLAGLAGGVVQNTPYIGHPAYKAMGARAGYTLATGLVIGLGAMTGVVSLLVSLVPEAAVAPVLVFVGLGITAQAFLASPRRHAPAVALAFVPTTAALVLLQVTDLLGGLDVTAEALRGRAADSVQMLRVLGNGFILSALLWASAAAMIVDRRLLAAAGFLSVASLATLCGLIHSPLPSGGLFWPGEVPSPWPARMAAGYGITAGLLALLAPWTSPSGPVPLAGDAAAPEGDA